MQPITQEERLCAQELVDFIAECPSMFHTVYAACTRLDEAGFTYVPESHAWEVVPGGRYYTTRNGSSVIAFAVGEHALDDRDAFHFQLAAAHADSPAFKIKSAPELEGPEGYLRLNAEAYGGMIDYTWFDRPLSLAGRVLVRNGAKVESRLVALDEDVALIPSLAVHLDRAVNDGFAPNRAIDLCPLFSAGELDAGAFDRMLAQKLGVEPKQILARDLFLYSRQKGCVWGAAGEFVSSPKLDDLMCAFASLKAFLASGNDACVRVWCCFDNEEVGSNTKQGAMSTILRDVLERTCEGLGLAREDYHRAVARSMMVSCDNAHAVHPNRTEKYDAGNRCRLNGGIVIKEAANQHYCTDAFSRAVFAAVCDDAGVPYQTFANKSDQAGGSTLGNLSNTQVSMHGVDVGCPQLAMHSSYETSGVRDVSLAIAALTAFYGADIRIDGASGATV